MLPASRFPSQAHARRLPPFRLAAPLLLIAVSVHAGAARAQDVGDDMNANGTSSRLDRPTASPTPASEPAKTTTTSDQTSAVANGGPVAFEADAVSYDQNSDTVTATGNVVLRRQDQSARSDKVTWNQTTGKVLATGNVRLVGTDTAAIVAAASQLLDDPVLHAAMSRPAFPYGEGDAAGRMLDAIEAWAAAR